MTMTTMTLNPATRDMHKRTPFVKAGDVEAYVTIRNPWQDGHKHTFDVWDKHGEALCIGCGATAWSAWWVAEDVYGTGTVIWVDEQIREQERKVLDTATTLVEERLGAKVVAEIAQIMAVHDGDAPAKHVSPEPLTEYDPWARKLPRHRAGGVPNTVPAMKPGLLVHPEHV